MKTKIYIGTKASLQSAEKRDSANYEVTPFFIIIYIDRRG